MQNAEKWAWKNVYHTVFSENKGYDHSNTLRQSIFPRLSLARSSAAFNRKILRVFLLWPEMLTFPCGKWSFDMFVSARPSSSTRLVEMTHFEGVFLPAAFFGRRLKTNGSVVRREFFSHTYAQEKMLYPHITRIFFLSTERRRKKGEEKMSCLLINVESTGITCDHFGGVPVKKE